MYEDLNGPIPADPKAALKKVESVTAKNQNIRKTARFLESKFPGIIKFSP